MPSRLRPTSSLAADAVLVGDPGRSLLLAQELLTQPKMSNHARGLWGYSGETPAGRPLTVQATGMGGPSAAIVLDDLAKLGVRRAVRIGSCAAHCPDAHPGELLVVDEAVAGGGSAAAFGVGPGAVVVPDPALTELLRAGLGGAGRAARIASLDTFPAAESLPGGAIAADLQTVTVLARAAQLGMAAAAVLIVAETAGGERASDEVVEEAAKRAGRSAARALSA